MLLRKLKQEYGGKMVNINKNTGVTLLALVITIVTLLILAGISIAAFTGENNIINKAEKLQETLTEKAIKEMIEIYNTNTVVNQIMGKNYTAKTFQQDLIDKGIIDNADDIIINLITGVVSTKKGENEVEVGILVGILEKYENIINTYNKNGTNNVEDLKQELIDEEIINNKSEITIDQETGEIRMSGDEKVLATIRIGNKLIKDVDNRKRIYIYEQGKDANLKFPTWTTLNSKDDLNPNWNEEGELGTYIGDNTWYYDVKTWEHNDETGEYNIDIHNSTGKIDGAKLNLDYSDNIQVSRYSCTRNSQNITLQPGKYNITLYGAGGGTGFEQGKLSGKGGYGTKVSGDIIINKESILYAYIGSKGGDATRSGNTTNAGGTGGYNGGGAGGADPTDPNEPEASGGGGGATDIRLVSGTWDNSESLNSRIMVASGGAGGVYYLSRI